MPETENPTLIRSTPAMTAAPDPELLDEPRPIRLSGFVALGLGLLSFTALFGAPMVIVPVLGTLSALWALRPYQGKRPVGLSVATIGLFVAVLFGVWGVTQRYLRQQTLSEQAVQFASNWLDLLAQGDIELAVELRAEPSRRQSATMPLHEYYLHSEDGQRAMTEFRENEAVKDVIRGGQQVRWELAGPPRAYTLNGRDMVDTTWRDLSGTLSNGVRVGLAYLHADGDEPAQWKVEACDVFFPPSS
jgi:hypothetical protein